MERWKHCTHPNQHKHVTCANGEWVLHSEAQAEIARLKANVERLVGDVKCHKDIAAKLLFKSREIHNDAIEKAASLFTHPEEEGIADRIRELKE